MPTYSCVDFDACSQHNFLNADKQSDEMSPVTFKLRSDTNSNESLDSISKSHTKTLSTSPDHSSSSYYHHVSETDSSKPATDYILAPADEEELSMRCQDDNLPTQSQSPLDDPVTGISPLEEQAFSIFPESLTGELEFLEPPSSSSSGQHSGYVLTEGSNFTSGDYLVSQVSTTPITLEALNLDTAMVFDLYSEGYNSSSSSYIGGKSSSSYIGIPGGPSNSLLDHHRVDVPGTNSALHT